MTTLIVLGVDAVCSSKVYSETQDIRDCYHYGTDVKTGGDVKTVLFPDFRRLANTGTCADQLWGASGAFF